MNKVETAALLAKVQAFDNRNVDESVILAWQEILEPHTFRDCSAAVTKYFRLNSKWIMPSHVVEAVQDIEDARVRAVKGDVRLSDRDAGTVEDWPGANRRLYRLVATGQMSAEDVQTYIGQNLELSTFAPTKAIEQ